MLLPIGTIGFETHRTHLLSKAIRWATRSHISHVFIVIGHVGNENIILEANGHRVDITFMRKYNKDNYFISAYFPPHNLTKKQLREAIAYTVNKYALEKYGWGQILSISLSGIFPKLTMFKQGIICSELAFYFLECLGLLSRSEDNKAYNPDRATPQDILLMVSGIYGRGKQPDFTKRFFQRY